MRYGTVIQYFPAKGFGFIQPDVGPDVFFHITALGACEPEPQIEPGQPVKYELMPSTDPQLQSARQRKEDSSRKPGQPPQRKARLVELIDKIPGASLEDTPQARQARHPRSRKKKPTWRR